MEVFLRTCLILGAAAESYSAPTPRSSSPQQQQPMDEALSLYNQGLSAAEFLFGLIQVESHDSENITFIIKETVCLKSDKKDKKCPFKEDGVVKNCTAPPPGHKGRRLKVRCQTVDTSDNGENNKSPGTMGNDPVYKLLPGKQNQRSDFLQFDNRRSQIGHSAASCISCIFDFLNTNPSGR
ncbi:uncharacterized protein LOC130331778 isoform X2 [Hyla sarda]|uniref:uncharacterized protein LOC130331778 isoform X2 n=1 Tax=Hyla sarda TaxID=327740 RepID=UPI0024C43F7B|nr:uncharacterized protein LOC130331778 isoform X2 [Hyla sarda]